MKNCLNFKMWLMPLVVVMFLFGNIVQTEAQFIRVLSSDPTSGGGDDEDLCVAPDANSFGFYATLETGYSLSFTAMVEWNSGEVTNFTATPIGTCMENGVLHNAWVCSLTFQQSFGSYIEPGADGVNFRISPSATSGIVTGGAGLRTINTGPILTGVTNYYLPLCQVETFGGAGMNLKENNTIKSPKIILDKAYPNPVSNELKLELTVNGEISDCSIKIVNQLGQTVKSSIINQRIGKGDFSKILDVSNLTKGIYFIMISSGNDVVTEKIIKM